MEADRTALLGELVAAAFDSAADYSRNPQEITRLAALVVDAVLRRSQKAWRAGG